MFHGRSSIDSLNTNANGVLSITLKSEGLSLQVKHAQTVDVFKKCL